MWVVKTTVIWLPKYNVNRERFKLEGTEEECFRMCLNMDDSHKFQEKRDKDRYEDWLAIEEGRTIQ